MRNTPQLITMEFLGGWGGVGWRGRGGRVCFYFGKNAMVQRRNFWKVDKKGKELNRGVRDILGGVEGGGGLRLKMARNRYWRTSQFFMILRCILSLVLLILISPRWGFGGAIDATANCGNMVFCFNLAAGFIS